MAHVRPAFARTGGAAWSLSVGLWVVLAARSVASIPFARAQVQRIKRRPISRAGVDLAQATGLAIVAAGRAAGAVPTAAMAGVAILAVGQAAWVRLRPPPVVVGVTQLIAGIAVALATASAIRSA